MLILPTIPPTPKPLTPAEFSQGRDGRAVTEESLAKYEIAETEQLIANRVRNDMVSTHSERLSILLLSIGIFAGAILLIIKKEWVGIIGLAIYAIIFGFPAWGLLTLILRPLSCLLIPKNKGRGTEEYAPEIAYTKELAIYESKLKNRTHYIEKIAKITGKTFQEVEKAYQAKELGLAAKAHLDCFEAYQDWIGSFHKYLDKQEIRKSEEYWLSLSGYDFEREVCLHFSRKGYSTRQTPLSNDGGIDIILSKDGEITYVQCKHHNTPIGISVARELLGVMSSKGVKKGILATIKGVNRNCLKFCIENGISVMYLEDFIDHDPKIDTSINLETLRASYYSYKYPKYELAGIRVLPLQFYDKDSAKEYAKGWFSVTCTAIIPQHPPKGETIYGFIQGEASRISEIAKAGLCEIVATRTLYGCEQ